MFRRFVRTIPKTLNLLALASLVLLLLKVFFLNDIPQPFAGLYELGIVFEGLLASVFASYVFYLIVVHVKEVRDQSIISPHITKWAQRVVGDCVSQITEFSKASGIELELATINEDATNLAFSKINPHSNAPLLLALNQYANWLQYWDYHRTRSKNYIAKIMTQFTFLDARLVALLTAVDDSSHFNMLPTLVHTQILNQDMSAFANTFHSYCVACRHLDNYLNETAA